MLETLAELARRLGPIAAAAVAAVFIIVGIVVIVHPLLLAWLAGLALILAGIGMLAAAISTSERSGL